MSYPTFNSHIEFLKFAIQLHQDNPNAVRLDLKTAEDKPTGNLKIAGVFLYPEKIEHQQYRHRWVKWRVNSDTKFAPLIEAQKLIDQGIYFPFESGRTNIGKGIKLNLIRSFKTSGLYIYKVSREHHRSLPQG
jgi:hypothetical protein